MTVPLVMTGLAEEIQEYVAENSGLGYVAGDGGNFTLEDAADIQDLLRLANSEILLTLFDEGGTLIPSARRTAQELSFRFAAKGGHAHEALDRARDLLSWLWNKRTFDTASFRVLVLRVPATPQVSVRGSSGSHVADFVVTVRAYNSS